jgi:hypothetical protein
MVSEDDLDTFEGWLKCQSFDPTTVQLEVLAQLQEIYDETRAQIFATPKVGLMKLRQITGEHRYAVAVRDGSDLLLILWVRRSPKGEFFVMRPMTDQTWNPHTSYHLDGTFHTKSFDRKTLEQKRQPLTGTFRGTEPLGGESGYSPKKTGAICDPAAFSGVVEVGPGVLGPRNGVVLVDLVEPGCEPISHPSTLIKQKIFRDVTPWVVIRIFS